ncbi:MAG: 50S ribosomal protein L22 [Deltaproteobacteria bacterium]|nr:50S ribosomal protein L22 [Deltaproteobacteria bacterium]
MEVKAVDRYIRVSPRKARLVADLVKGKPVSDALSILEFTPRAISIYLYKLIRSAVANASHKQGVDVDVLFVKNVLVDQGPTLKRFRPGPQGRGFRILKRTCHLTVILDEA